MLSLWARLIALAVVTEKITPLAKNRKNTEKKRKQSRFETIIENSQIPIFVALLFFIFHMPIVNTYIFRKFAFLSIYDTDGNFNTYGLLLKSALFGFIYYFFSGLTQWLSEI